MKERQTQQKVKIELIIGGAIANQELENGLHRVTIQLLLDCHKDSPSKASLIRCIKEQFDIDGITVLLQNQRTADMPGIDYPSISQRVAHLGSACDDRLASNVIRSLFGDADPSIHSCAFIPLTLNDQLAGVIVLGSIDPERFKPSFEVMFLDRIGAIASAYLQPCL